ncbi:NADH-quinone oxidoreductase subunit N [Nonomuraea thailandensis]|uniref:NADH-quinone oxidoreductase subunit N n=1 Tax=Nonomuraea thailandensis TaxID=1188745 RepID=A0A9X2GB23_9ACTN|nr:NADH-quinone oxidoreductase subunit N [Nonomuraea thailandensis]MCP2355904.1 NADH-quinone oxidoreductase subunit N [Nonomuraea thailandensis]
MNENPLDLLPELLILLGAVAGLLAGLFLPRRRQRLAGRICGTALVAALAATLAAAFRPDLPAFEAYSVDPLTHVARATVIVATLLVLVLTAGWARDHHREAELYVLVMLAALGTVILAGAGDLLVLVAAYLLASIPAYALAGFAKDAAGTEAALKYYLMGAFLGVLMLAGVTLLYSLAGTTAYQEFGQVRSGVAGLAVVLLLAGLLFKAGGVPAHFWVPDVTEGTSRAVAAFVTTVPKIGAFIALLRLASEVFAGLDTGWRPLIAIIATATMTLGNLAAFHQDNVRRLLAYSTISQAGYLLIPIVVAGRSELAEPALLFYVAAYAITNLGAFAVVLAAGKDVLADYAGLARSSPGLVLALIVCLLGLVGTPPTAVFVGKVLVFAAAWDGGYAWLAVVAVVNTVASVFYYLRWIRPAFRRGGTAAVTRTATWIAYVAAAVSLLLGAGSGAVLAGISYGS